MRSRIHRLRCAPAPDVWIKRDDELGFGTTGSKARKYQSLVPALLADGVTAAVVEGGSRSNNVLVASQLLRQAGIAPRLVFRETRLERSGNGNRLLVELLTREDERTWLGRVDEATYEKAVATVMADVAAAGGKAARIPLGASCEPALAGALTLGEDIVRNEREHAVEFARIFIDSGTGLTWIAAMLGMAALGRTPLFEVVVVAGKAAEAEGLVARYAAAAGADTTMLRYRTHSPVHGASYGAVTAEGLRFASDFARSEGVLVDPVYTGKLFGTAYELLRADPAGPALIVHTGGGTGIFGFAERFGRG